MKYTTFCRGINWDCLASLKKYILYVTAFGHRPATSWVNYTTRCTTHSNAPENGQNNCPKHVDLTGIINKLLLLHLVDCLYYLYQRCTVKQISDNEIYLLSKYVKSVLWRVTKRLSYIEDARCLKAKCRGVFMQPLKTINLTPGRLMLHALGK